MVGTGGGAQGTTRLFDFHMYAQSNRACHETALHIKGMCTFLAHFHSRAILDQVGQFFTYNSIIIEFKGILMKLKNVALAIPEEKLFFTIFDVLLLTYKPSNFAQAILSYAAG